MAVRFFKVNASVAHWHGAGKGQEVPIYIYGKDAKDAMIMVKRLPMIKHQNLPLSSLQEVGEKEFVVGNIKNAYEPYKVKESSKVVSLDQLANRLWYLLDGGYRFVEPEGIKLKKFCDEYMVATKKQQKKIDQKYTEWATEVIEESSGEDENEM